MAAALQALAQSIQKYSMYPPGHPALEPAVDQVMEPLRRVLAERAVLAVGVAAAELEVEGTQTSPEHPRYTFLAGRLHRHQLTAVSFSAGIGREEVAGFLAAVATEAERCEHPLGAAPPEELPAWPHLRLRTIPYEKLAMASDRSREELRPKDDLARKESERGRLWLGLARAALVSEAVDGEHAEYGGELDGPDRVASLDADGDMEQVARAVEDFSTEATYAEEVLNHLVTISRELRSAQGSEADSLRHRTSRLVSLVRPEALRRVLRDGGDAIERRRLLLDASQWMEPDSMVKLVQATAGVERQDISHWLLLMMSKLARHASTGGAARKEAESTLREQVSQLVTDWGLEDAVPTQYSAALERMSQATSPPTGAGKTVAVEPERILMIALETDQLGEPVWTAAKQLTSPEHLGELLGLLESAPPDCSVAEEIWERVADPKLVLRTLEEEEPDFHIVDSLVARLGLRAAEPMLEVLANSEFRGVRRQLFSRLADLGSEAAPLVIDYLDDPRWFVRRNMLALLSKYEEWPRKWTPATHAEDAHPAVRREAHKLMLRTPHLRDAAVCALLEDEDPRSISLGLGAAQEGVSPEAIPLLVALAEDEALRLELRTPAVRALGRERDPQGLEVLLRLVRDEGGWLSRLFGRWRLAPSSPLVLEALAALFRTWRDEPRAQRVFARANRSDDPEIRAAAGGRMIR